MSVATKPKPDPSLVLAKAVRNAAERLDLKQEALSKIIGRDRSSIARNGIDPASNAGRLSALFLRLYRSLAVMVDDDEAQMRHWMHTANAHTGGVPAEQIHHIESLVGVVNYLDSVRGKV